MVYLTHIYFYGRSQNSSKNRQMMEYEGSKNWVGNVELFPTSSYINRHTGYRLSNWLVAIFKDNPFGVQVDNCPRRGRMVYPTP